MRYPGSAGRDAGGAGAPGRRSPGSSPARPPARRPVLWCPERSPRCGPAGARAGSRSWRTPATPTPSPASIGRSDGRRPPSPPPPPRSASPEGHVLVASTGVIGEPLRRSGSPPGWASSPHALDPAAPGAAARAIMTTDTFPKGAAGAPDARRRAGDDRGLRQGLGHDRARHGDDARLPLHRRGGRAGAAAGDGGARPTTRPSTASPSTATPRPPNPSSRRHRTRADAADRRPGGPAAARFEAALRASCATWRTRSCATARAPRSSSRCA